MTFLPIVERELRVASRRRGTYLGRALLAFLIIGIGVCIFCMTLEADRSEAGPILFRSLSGVLLAYALFYGARSTADCLSSEKREGTLGLLFLTDLKGYDVVLGKITASSLGGFYGLLGVFPVLAVPLLMGGITQGEFWRMVIVLIVTFLFSLTVGIFASAVFRETRSAMSASFLLTITPSILLPGVGAIILANTNGRTFVRDWFLASPGYPFALSFDRFYITEWQNFWTSLAIIHALTWLFVILASCIIPRVWQDRPAQSANPGLRELWRRGRYGTSAQRAALRQRLLHINAFFWLACRDRRKRRRVWYFLAFMTGWWIWGRIQFGGDWDIAAVSLAAAFLLNAAFKTWVAFESSERLAEDRNGGALELLLSTRLTVRDIVRGQRLALFRIFLAPALVVFIVEIYLMWVCLLPFRGDSEFRTVLLTWLAGFLMMAADIVALFWVSMHAAMSTRRPQQAASIAMLRVLALPWVLVGLAQTVIALGAYMEFWPEPGFLLYLFLWVFFGLIFDLLFGVRSRWILLTQFRELPARNMLRRRTHSG